MEKHQQGKANELYHFVGYYYFREHFKRLLLAPPNSQLIPACTHYIFKINLLPRSYVLKPVLVKAKSLLRTFPTACARCSQFPDSQIL